MNADWFVEALRELASELEADPTAEGPRDASLLRALADKVERKL